MRRTVFKSGNSTVISLPKEIMEYLGIGVGDDIEIDFGENEREVVITTRTNLLAGDLDEDFARQVSEFIERYRPTLEALAQQ